MYIKWQECSRKNNNILLDIPVFEENYELISLNLVKYCFNTIIDFSIKLSKYIKNTILQIKVNNINDANKIIDHFIENKDIKETVKSRALPFLYQIGLIGIYTENKPYSFKNIFIQYLYLYYSKIKNEDDIDLDSFIKYIEGTYKNEKKINKKRILNVLYNVSVTKIQIFNNISYKTNKKKRNKKYKLGYQYYWNYCRKCER